MDPNETQIQQQPAPTNGHAPAPNEQAPQTMAGGKNVMMPRNAFNARLEAATERGKRAALGEMEAAAKKAGFASVEDMFSTIAALKTGGGQPSRETPPARDAKPATSERRQDDRREARRDARQPQRNDREQRRYEALLDKERKAREAERRMRLTEERKRKELERERDRLEVDMAIREQAVIAGVKDVDYAVELLRRSIEGKSAEELRGFDEAGWFAKLRDDRPYLFGERVVPATTGTGGGEPGAPKPGEAARGQAAAGQVDANKLNPKEFAELMRKRGWDPNAAG